MTWCVNKKILKAIDWTLRIAPELFYPFNGRPHRSQVHEERLAADSGRSSGSWFVLLLTPSRPGRLGALGQWPIVRFVPTHSGGTARELHPFPYARIYACCALNLSGGQTKVKGILVECETGDPPWTTATPCSRPSGRTVPASSRPLPRGCTTWAVTSKTPA